MPDLKVRPTYGGYVGRIFRSASNSGFLQASVTTPGGRGSYSGPMVTRREFLAASTGLAGVAAAGCVPPRMAVGSPYASALPAMDVEGPSGVLVNDLHSGLNPTRVARVVKPATVAELRDGIQLARDEGRSISIAGGRHAMGGQQFGEANVLIDTRSLNRVLAFDAEAGIITAEGGIQWPELIRYVNDANSAGIGRRQWGIFQKQTGADRLSLAGALACNAHGRGLNLKPIIDQVRAFDLVDATGAIRTCSRTEHSELFGLAIGGYGLFGVVTRVELSLRPRVKVRRVVELAEMETIAERFEERIHAGYLYGDFQYATDAGRDSFLGRGVFSCYEPVPMATPLTVNPTRFNPEDWAQLTFYAHKYKGRAFQVYSERYLATSGQIYWADSQLSAAYVDNYHRDVDVAMHARAPATEMITEIYVPRTALADFMADAREVLRGQRANVVYGTIRLIEKDDESFLAWAKERFACVIFNLHVEHTEDGIERAVETFRSLIDLGIEHRGSYYLTYHRWARKEQVERCYPQMRRFLELKRQYDPQEMFQSTWYRHYRAMLS
jgi:FAD/FMN-containing dehydrogenase